MKSDGYPTYNFAHIIDDHEMGVTHIIRGQEFLASMPNYLNLYVALEIPIIKFATVPHIMNENGNKKLSKRDGAKDILDYRDEGYLPEAMLNFLASLGWNDGTEQEVFTVSELIEKFSLDRIQKSGARFDERRLLWLNGAHIRNLSLDDLYEKVTNYWPEEAKDFPEEYKKSVLGLLQERLKIFSELPELSRYFFVDLPVNPELISTHKQLKKLPTDELKSLLQISLDQLNKTDDWTAESIQNTLNDLLENSGKKPAELFSLIRIATTQSPSSPGLAETLELLGKEKSLVRLETHLSTL
jgi:glutamyl/glutaminyl-tRNA synthetase